MLSSLYKSGTEKTRLFLLFVQKFGVKWFELLLRIDTQAGGGGNCFSAEKPRWENGSAVFRNSFRLNSRALSPALARLCALFFGVTHFAKIAKPFLLVPLSIPFLSYKKIQGSAMPSLEFLVRETGILRSARSALWSPTALTCPRHVIHYRRFNSPHLNHKQTRGYPLDTLLFVGARDGN